LSCLFAVDDAIGCDEAIGEGGFAVIDMCDYRYVSDALCAGEELSYSVAAGFLADHYIILITTIHNSLTY